VGEELTRRALSALQRFGDRMDVDQLFLVSSFSGSHVLMRSGSSSPSCLVLDASRSPVERSTLGKASRQQPPFSRAELGWKNSHPIQSSRPEISSSPSPSPSSSSSSQLDAVLKGGANASLPSRGALHWACFFAPSPLCLLHIPPF